MARFMNGRELGAQRELARMAIAEGHQAREALRREQEHGKEGFIESKVQLEADSRVLEDLTRSLIGQGYPFRVISGIFDEGQRREASN